jgi:hypothetical protein
MDMTNVAKAAEAGEFTARSRLIRDRFDVLALALLVAHGVYWTVMPALASGTVPLDTGEALFWGREWQLGYYKHPPLSAWLAEAGVAAFGRNLAAVYLVPQLCVAAAFAAVWWLARRLVSSAGAFLSIAALTLFLPFTVESPTFNANVALLPFWAWSIAFAWTALEEDTTWAWARLGIAVGLGLLAKYSILILGAAIVLYCASTPGRRGVFWKRGPWLALAAALLVSSPHLYWLATGTARPLAYAATSKGVGSTVHALPQLGLFLGHQLLIYLPLLAVAAVWALASGRGLRRLRPASPPGPDRRRREALRFLLFAAFAPIVLTLAAALALGQKTPMSWGYTFPIAAGLLAVLAWPWLERDLLERRVPRRATLAFVAMALLLALAWPVHLWASGRFGLPAPKTAYDGAAHGALVDAFWAKRRAEPLRYQASHFGGAGDRALGSSTAFFSRHRPSVFHGADLRRSPWIDLDAFRRHGGVVVAEAPIPVGTPVAGLCVTEVERFERPILYRGYRPAFFHVGLLAPSPEPQSSCP